MTSSLCGSRVVRGRPSEAAQSSTGCRGWLRCCPSRSPSRSRKAARVATIPGSGRSTRGSRVRRCSIEEIDPIQAARDLAALVAALQLVSPAGAPPGRGIPLAERDQEIRHWLARFDGDPAVTAEWERALAAPPWDGAARLAPRRPRRPQLARPGRAHQRRDRLGHDGRRRPGVRRDGRMEAAFACRARCVSRGSPDGRRDLGAGARLGTVAGGRSSCLLHAGEQLDPVSPRSSELARPRAVRAEQSRRQLPPPRHPYAPHSPASRRGTRSSSIRRVIPQST